MQTDVVASRFRGALPLGLIVSGSILIACSAGRTGLGGSLDVGAIDTSTSGDVPILFDALSDNGAQDTSSNDTGSQDTGSQDAGSIDTGCLGGNCPCLEGTFGADCTPCDCQNGATCDQGRSGTGACTCAPDFYGTNCGQACACASDEQCDDGVDGTGTCSSCSDHLCNGACVVSVVAASYPHDNGDYHGSDKRFGQSFTINESGRLLSFRFFSANTLSNLKVTVELHRGQSRNDLIATHEQILDGTDHELIFTSEPAVTSGHKYSVIIDQHGTRIDFKREFYDDSSPAKYTQGDVYAEGSFTSIADLRFSVEVIPCALSTI